MAHARRAFKLEGFLVPGEALEVSVGLVLRDGSATTLRVRNLGALYAGVDRLAPLGPSGTLAEAERVETLTGLGEAEVARFAVSVARV